MGNNYINFADSVNTTFFMDAVTYYYLLGHLKLSPGRGFWRLNSAHFGQISVPDGSKIQLSSISNLDLVVIFPQVMQRKPPRLPSESLTSASSLISIITPPVWS